MTDPIPLPATVTMAPVDSSHHRAAAYDAAAQQLYIDFAKPGAPANIYRYSNVTPADWAAYQASESKGKYFLAHIKPNPQKYPYVRIAAPAPAL